MADMLVRLGEAAPVFLLLVGGLFLLGGFLIVLRCYLRGDR